MGDLDFAGCVYYAFGRASSYRPQVPRRAGSASAWLPHVYDRCGAWNCRAHAVRVQTTAHCGVTSSMPAASISGPECAPRRLLRWRDIYREAEFYKAAIRIYTKPLFHWRKALSVSTDGKNLYDLASEGLRKLEAIHKSLRREEFTFRPAVAMQYN